MTEQAKTETTQAQLVVIEPTSAVALFTATIPGGGLYGESVTSKWGQLLVVDALYATFAARRFDETLGHLEETYAAAIQHSRSG